MKSKKKKLGLLLIIGFAFPLFLNYSFIFSNKHNYITDNPKISGTYYNIEIDDSATGPGANNWTWARTQPWCTKGDGTQENPYVIEDSIFLPSGLSDCLTVANSSKYFVVENCTFKDTPVNGYTGIRLKNVINAFIIDNQVYNNYHGIYCVNVNNSRIIDNYCSYNAFYGIYLASNCSRNTLSGNTANDNDDTGIYLENNCDNNTLSGNTANYNIWWGISMYSECDNNTLSGNTANNNWWGLFLENNCDRNTLSGNTANNNWKGISMYSECDNNTLSGNTANLNNYGIFLYDDCSWNNITGNTANLNDYGIYLYNDCSRNTLSGNTANLNDYGICLYNDCSRNTLSGNTASLNYIGIYLTSNCDRNTLSGNTANSNDNTGIYLEINCDNNTLSGNTANLNDYGITLNSYCDNNTLSGNTANNNWAGIVINDECDNNTITENVLYNNTQGIEIGSINCNNTSIYKNFFLENEKHAVDYGTDNKWNSTTIGNYWNNWTSPDVNNDGIVDVPYNISLSPLIQDHLPIAEDGAPRITIDSPSEGDAFSSNALNFSVTITDIYVFKKWYTLDGGVHNYTFTENGMINQSMWDEMDDGTITLTFYASDIVYQYFNNITHIGSAEVSIIKDTVAPVITINSPAEGERFGNTAPSFNITVKDDNLDVVWYSFDGGLTTFAITNNTILEQTVWATLDQGNVTITFYANDLAGNEASESVTVIKSIPSGLGPGVIITIIIVSIVGGVAAISVVYIFVRKRVTPA